ncbi:hypothetical protein F3Y22_tig00110621pilonHSYRG00215 [Hibiscus syriacus]|uniref:Uncharacterized protein n=1 Tax=Hibiscus syriacus TaxID=106335 RepID=A0A6A3A0R0_HIBSY|nr:hypothetical protein F3Y22_tig00110621pilonHSYRG00215 [Hibiscus syriacus]
MACKRMQTRAREQVRGLVFVDGDVSQKAATAGDDADKQNASYGPYVGMASIFIGSVIWGNLERNGIRIVSAWWS